MSTPPAAWTIAASLLALTLGACDASNGYETYGYAGDPSYGHYCSQFSSCDTCTPVNGCGWCYDSDGTGMCASDPDECPTQSFSWTWDTNGCRVGADAGVGPAEDGGSGPATEASASTDAAPAADATPWTDAALAEGAPPAPDGASALDASGVLP
jgi:hypothetical protein